MSTIVDEYRAGLRDGKLLIQVCNECDTKILYPRHRCIACGSNKLGWVAASGKGILHTYTIVRAVPPAGFEGELPYGLGVVKLTEGVQLLGRLHPGSHRQDWSGYACDVAVQFKPASTEAIASRPVAWFAPVAASGSPEK